MKIYDEANNLICDSEGDPKKYNELQSTGTFTSKQIVIAHHEAVMATHDEIIHKPDTIYFTDGTSQKIPEGDPHIVYDDRGLPLWHDLEGDEHHYFGMNVIPVTVKKGTVATPEWDEIEDILIYIPYTEEEQLNRQKMLEMNDFLNNAPELYKDILKVDTSTIETQNKLNAVQHSIEDVNLALAETFETMVSTDDDDYRQMTMNLQQVAGQLETVTLLLAELVGAEE